VQTTFIRERVLPDLARNIQCGNSLIGPKDYQPQSTMFDEQEAYRVNPFDWDKSFPAIMGAGGFDAVIGNPPYIRIQTMKEWAPLEVELYKRRYVAAKKGNYDIYVVFVEKGLSLLNPQGRLGFIVPNKFFNAQYGELLRGLIGRGKHLEHVVHFGDQQVFAGATTYTCLLFLSKAPSQQVQVLRVEDLADWRNADSSVGGAIPSDSVTEREWNFVVGSSNSLFEKLKNMPLRLGDVATRIFQGIIPGADKVYSVELLAIDDAGARCHSRALNSEVYLEAALLRKIVSGAEVNRYTMRETRARVIYPYIANDDNAILIPPDELERTYPLTFEYFLRTRELLDARDRGSAKGDEWYKYIRRQNIALQPHQKLAVPRLVGRLQAGYDSDGSFCLDNVDVGGVILSDSYSRSYRYILGLLNSKLINFYFVRTSVPFRGGFFSANRQYIEGLPIREINFADSADRNRHDQIVELVKRMLALHRQRAAARTPTEQTMLDRQIAATDAQIDHLVYALYGLTEAEIALVDGAR
jgi:hypothetical protein